MTACSKVIYWNHSVGVISHIQSDSNLDPTECLQKGSDNSLIQTQIQLYAYRKDPTSLIQTQIQLDAYRKDLTTVWFKLRSNWMLTERIWQQSDSNPDPTGCLQKGSDNIRLKPMFINPNISARKEENVLFNNALKSFTAIWHWIYGKGALR